MNFDEAYEKVLAGTATDEEKTYVNTEIDKIRRISAILDTPPASPVIAEADTETVMRARKSFNKKTTIKIAVITLLSLLAIAALVCGIIFIPSCTSASRSEKIDSEEALELAIEYLSNYTGEDASQYLLRDIDRELRIPDGLGNAIYVYEIELRTPDGGLRYELEVSAKSGYVVLTDVDHRD